MGRCSWRRSGRKSRTQDPHSLAVNRPSTSPPSPPPNPARPSFLRRALYGSCGCDSLPVRSTRRSNKDASLSVSLPSQCFQQSTANTSAHRHPSPAITEHTASSPRSTSPRHGKRVAKRPTFLPVSRNCLCPPDPRLCYSVPKSIPVSQPAARCVLSSATHSQRRPLASLTAPISWPAGATEKHLLLGSATPFPAFYNPLLRQGPALRFWYLHTTAIRAPALRFRILPVSAKTPT